MSESAMDTLKGILGDDADEKIKTALSAFGSSSGSESGVIDTQAIDSMMQIKDIINNFASSENDSRTNLLMSLRPFMRGSRQNSIDAAVRMLNLTKLSGLFRMR